MRTIKEKDVSFSFDLESQFGRHTATGMLVVQCSVCQEYGPIAISAVSLNEEYNKDVLLDNYWEKLAGYVPILGHRYGPVHHTYAHQHCFIEIEKEDIADVWIKAKKTKNLALLQFAKSSLAIKTQGTLEVLSMPLPNKGMVKQLDRAIPTDELIRLDLLMHLMAEELSMLVNVVGCLSCQQKPCICGWIDKQQENLEDLETRIFSEMQRRNLVSIF